MKAPPKVDQGDATTWTPKTSLWGSLTLSSIQLRMGCLAGAAHTSSARLSGTYLETPHSRYTEWFRKEVMESPPVKGTGMRSFNAHARLS